MILADEKLSYEFQAKDISQKEAIKQYADHIAKEIKSIAGWDADVQIHIEPQAKDKHLFSVAMSVFGIGETFVSKKEGKNILAVMRKVRRGVLRQIYKLHKKRISHRRKQFLKEQMAS